MRPSKKMGNKTRAERVSDVVTQIVALYQSTYPTESVSDVLNRYESP
jgi:hypothetical protein